MSFASSHIVPDYTYKNARKERDYKLAIRKKEIEKYNRDRRKRHEHRSYYDKVGVEIKKRWKKSSSTKKILFSLLIIVAVVFIAWFVYKQSKKRK